MSIFSFLFDAHNCKKGCEIKEKSASTDQKSSDSNFGPKNLNLTKLLSLWKDIASIKRRLKASHAKSLKKKKKKLLMCNSNM